MVANSGSLADYTIKHCTMLHFNTNLLFISWNQFILSKTSKFDWTLDDIKTEKISRFVDGIILNLIRGHSTILCIKKEAVEL